jgi:hypothetical protein
MRGSTAAMNAAEVLQAARAVCISVGIAGDDLVLNGKAGGAASAASMTTGSAAPALAPASASSVIAMQET